MTPPARSSAAALAAAYAALSMPGVLLAQTVASLAALSEHPLPDGRSIFVERYLVEDEYSELKGWRERVSVSDSPFGGTLELEVDCADAGGFAARGGRLAFHCGQEWVAELLLHAVIIYDELGRQIHYIEHCRDLAWASDQVVTCNSEQVTFDGALELRRKEVPLTAEATPQGPPERLWLVIGASDEMPGVIARQARSLSGRFPQGLVVQTKDCGEETNSFAWVAEASLSPETAEAALSRLRASMTDAFVRPCDARPGTLLALRMTAVDPSVADMSDWGYVTSDGVSSAHPLPDGRLILIPRSFEIATNGDYADLREPVFIAEPSGGAPRLLVEDCAYPGHFITQGDLLAFDCAQEVFADFLVYGVLVFDRAGRQLAKVERCRYPIWSGDHVIACRKLVWDSWPKEHTLIRTVIGE
ncbi:MAG TPA: hypothetical protein VED46_05950 [Alphaproteobacteria bacterium]|nr:hypothetical protein [Alphaproteobacteria bacterium]